MPEILRVASSNLRAAPAVETGDASLFDRIAIEQDGRIILLVSAEALLAQAGARSPGILGGAGFGPGRGRGCGAPVTRVLVADDSALMRKVLGDILRPIKGLDVAFARDGIEAIAQLHAFKPDVVTLDIHMPRMDGLECLNRIMLERPCRVIIVSSLTADGADVTLEAMALGAVDFITKPRGAISLAIEEFGPDLVERIRCAASMPLRRTSRLKDRIRLQADAALARTSAARRRTIPPLARPLAARSRGSVPSVTDAGGRDPARGHLDRRAARARMRCSRRCLPASRGPCWWPSTCPHRSPGRWPGGSTGCARCGS